MARTLCLLLIGITALFGCNCTSLSSPKGLTIDTDETIFQKAELPRPKSPPPPAKLECTGIHIRHRAQQLVPTVAYIFNRGEEDGLEELDSLSQGMGITSVCCAAEASLGILAASAMPQRTMSAILAGDVYKRIVGFILSRCYTKEQLKSGQGI